MVALLWENLQNTNGLQIGFKQGMSTVQCTWLVSEVVNQYLKSGNPVITTLLDYSKAFDLCQFSTLFMKHLKRNVPKIVVRTLMSVYTQQEAWVKWNNVCSERKHL